MIGAILISSLSISIREKTLENLAIVSFSFFYIGLLSTGINNFVSISFLFFAFCSGVFPIIIRWKVPSLFLILLAYAVYRVAYYFIVNDNIPIFDIDFLNNEGRFFILILVILSLSSIRPSIITIRKFVQLSLIFYLVWVPIFLLHILSGKTLIDASHHQLGLTALTGLLYGTFLERSNFLWASIKWIVILLSIVCLYYSSSRTSLIAGILILGITYWNKVGFKRKLVLFVSIIALIGSLINLGQFKFGNRIYDLTAFKSIFEGIKYGLENPEEISKALDSRKSDIETDDANIIGRAVVYGKALHLFYQSPIFGVGEGRFDDEATCESPEDIICIHTHGDSNFNGNSAHNAFLHVLAEEGIVGLFFVFIILWRLRHLIKKKYQPIINGGLNPNAFIATWWAFLFASLFQHSLASPLYALTLLLPIIIISSIRLKKDEKV